MGRICVLRPVDRQEPEFRSIDSQPGEDLARAPGHRQMLLKRVEHRVAHPGDALGDAFPREVFDRRIRWTEEECAHVVDDCAIDLLRHPPVEAAEPGFDMGHRNLQFRAHECSRERRVGIAVDQQSVGVPIQDRGFDAGHHACGLGGVRSRPHLEIAVGCGDSELPEEQVRHRVVVMLARVQQELFVLLAKHPRHGRGLDELWPGSYHREDPHRPSI